MAALFVLCGPRCGLAAPPNVLLIISDDQGWSDFGFMGSDEIHTPHLDRLAAQSAVFTRGYVPTSVCRPSLATIVTGLYPHEHGITSNDPDRGVSRDKMLRHIQQHATLPRLLAAEGFLSLQTGKWWEGDYHLGGFTHGMTVSGRHGGEGLTIGREGLEPIFEFLRDCDDSPFFVWFAPMMPHTPHNPPERLLAKYQADGRSPHTAAYAAMCEWFDESCGELLEFLDREELSQNTLVVFAVDNGWIQNPDIQWFLPRSKMSPYERGVRTPIMLRWPGRIQPSRDETMLISTIDLAPTILTACGIRPSAAMPGIDLLSVINGTPANRDILYGEIFTHDAFVIDQRAAGLMHRWCVTDQWKLIVPHAAAAATGPLGIRPDPRSPRDLATGRAALFDVLSDPEETRNLADERPEIVSSLRRKIDNWWTGPE